MQIYFIGSVRSQMDPNQFFFSVLTIKNIYNTKKEMQAASHFFFLEKKLKS